MAILATDNLIIERGGEHYKAPVSALPSVGAGIGGVATITIPSGRFEYSEEVAATGVTGTSRIMLGLAPTLDTDENCAEMLDIVSFDATPGVGVMTIIAAFSQPTSGPVKFNWSAS